MNPSEDKDKQMSLKKVRLTKFHPSESIKHISLKKVKDQEQSMIC